MLPFRFLQARLIEQGVPNPLAHRSEPRAGKIDSGGAKATVNPDISRAD
jgi:hypothetical protein